MSCQSLAVPRCVPPQRGGYTPKMCVDRAPVLHRYRASICRIPGHFFVVLVAPAATEAGACPYFLHQLLRATSDATFRGNVGTAAYVAEE